MKAAKAWEKWGEVDAYYGVVSHDEFRDSGMDEAAKERFFKGGEEHIDMVWNDVRSFYPGFQPSSALDFGCGVGRLLIPIAKRCGRAMGVDVSPGMLAEAQKNCAKAGVSNAALSQKIEGRHDFVNSFIVFQHIPQSLGRRLMRELVDSLNPGGVGALHFVYAGPKSRARRVARFIRQKVPFAHSVANLVTGFRGPLMQMNPYNVNWFFGMLHETGCEPRHARFTDHSGWRGVLHYFQKTASPGT